MEQDGSVDRDNTPTDTMSGRGRLVRRGRSSSGARYLLSARLEQRGSLQIVDAPNVRNANTKSAFRYACSGSTFCQCAAVNGRRRGFETPIRAELGRLGVARTMDVIRRPEVRA